uniref:Uncharacterized protein n=1 Tax=Pipistrellus kuhlii TaxID=59472 RepID=A0A7J7TQ69_PIPKU|nr:hypothetical protein mPipKuh1_009292 [Pipistrellus kuhlii]
MTRKDHQGADAACWWSVHFHCRSAAQLTEGRQTLGSRLARAQLPPYKPLLQTLPQSRSRASPKPHSGFSPPPPHPPAACRLAHFFVLCRISTDCGLEPVELAGKAGPWQRPLIPAGQAEGPHLCTNPCTRPLVCLSSWRQETFPFRSPKWITKKKNNNTPQPWLSC